MGNGKSIRWPVPTLLLAFFGAGVVLIRFEYWGPFKLILPVQSPVNAECIIGLAFLFLLFLRAHAGNGSRAVEINVSNVVLGIAVAIFTALPFLITVNAPLLDDSYARIEEAAGETWSKALTFFVHPTGFDRFFRPFAYLAYWVDFKWAYYNPFRWHVWNLIAHVANTCLVYVLATELGLARFSAVIAALLFGVHGTRPEVVSWLAARFDLLACFFVLAALVCLNRYLATRRPAWYIVMLCSALLAVLSKEAAYCLPFLALGLILFKPSLRKDILRAAGVLFALCGAVFLYRCWVIGGVGGYQTVNGESAVLQFSVIHTIKGLFFRQWSFLFFPINWSDDLQFWVKASIILMLLVMLGFFVYSTTNRRLLLAALVMILLAEVPVQHMLLMTADLAGARVLYLPVLGLALFWGFLIQGCRQRQLRISLAAGLLVFQFTAVCHNLMIWRKVAFLSEKTCRALGTELARDSRPVIVQGLPSTWHGVFFLRNGFAECVQLNSPYSGHQIYIEDDQHPLLSDPRLFSWDNSVQGLKELTSRSTQ